MQRAWTTMTRAIFIVLEVLVCRIVSSGGSQCKFGASVNLTDSTLDNVTHNIRFNNVTYTPANYYTQNNMIYGCLCEVRDCIRKCCPTGEIMFNKTCTSNATYPDIKETAIATRNADKFEIFYGIVECPSPRNRYILEDFEFVIENDGKLKYDTLIIGQEDYCVDFFFSEVPLALVCTDPIDRTDQTFLSPGMIISMPFLLVTFLVYAILPERNLPAKALMCYVLSLFFAYIMLVTIQLYSLGPTSCTVIAFLCYFFFMVSFFWMNSSCIDIWLTFSGIKGMTGQRTHERKRFMYYSMYSWGVPLIMVCIVIWANQSTDIPAYLHPGIGNGQCWFSSQLQTGVYFYFPIAFLVGSNIVLFAITAIKIIQVQRDTKMLNAKDSTKHENDKQRFNLYVKLVFAMGVNWSMEIISWVVMWQIKDSAGWIWYLTDFCNAMYGVFIFFIFVFKKNIWILLKKRYLQFTGKPQQAHRYGLSSTHRTTVSQVTSSSEA